jgi:hypothetical protein
MDCGGRAQRRHRFARARSALVAIPHPALERGHRTPGFAAAQSAVAASEHIMVFGQAPCSAGRSKRRNVSYLGLLPFPVNGLCDITDIYVTKYGAPRPGEKVFIVTVQQNNGWEGIEQETSEIIPPKPMDPPAHSLSPLTLTPHMHMGCTRDVEGTNTTPVPEVVHRSALPTGDTSATAASPGGGGFGESATKGQSRASSS